MGDKVGLLAGLAALLTGMAALVWSIRRNHEQTAKEEVLDYQLNTTEMYGEFLDTNTRPG